MRNTSHDLRAIKKALKKTRQHVSANRNKDSAPSLEVLPEPSQDAVVCEEDAPIEVRIELAIKALNLGGEPAEICGLLDWKEFEHLSLKAFELNGYEAIKGLTFSSKMGRFQIDVLASKYNIMLCVDCKHWMFSHWFNRLKEATKAHLSRTEAFAKNIKALTNKLPPKLPKKIFIIPVMLTLGDPRSQVIDGVPIVSVLKLRDFLYGLPYPPDSGLKYYIAEIS